MDLITGLTCLHLGQLDTSEAALVVSVQTFQQGTDRREGVVADIALAQMHVQAGEPGANGGCCAATIVFVTGRVGSSSHTH